MRKVSFNKCIVFFTLLAICITNFNCKKDEENIKQLKNPLQIEKYAREKYYMKKDSEDIFLIIPDSVEALAGVGKFGFFISNWS